MMWRLNRRGVHWTRMVCIGGVFAPIEWSTAEEPGTPSPVNETEVAA